MSPSVARKDYPPSVRPNLQRQSADTAAPIPKDRTFIPVQARDQVPEPKRETLTQSSLTNHDESSRQSDGGGAAN
jgi:hypothetical protein